jgi:hypothetical protein
MVAWQSGKWMATPLLLLQELLASSLPIGQLLLLFSRSFDYFCYGVRSSVLENIDSLDRNLLTELLANNLRLPLMTISCQH